MEGKANYQFRVLPMNPKKYMFLDSEPQRKCEEDLVYKMEDVFVGEGINFRIRERARRFTEYWKGSIFAVICNNQCMYFGKLFIIQRDYPSPHVKPVLYMVRCVGKTTSKKHFSKVTDYVLSHYKEISKLVPDDVIEVNM